MRIQLLRNATLLLNYAGKKIIIDPNFAGKHTMPSYTGSSLNPLVDLPCNPLNIIKDLDFTIISHLHTDHFDCIAQNLLPKNLPILCQSEDTYEIRSNGFQNVLPIIDYIVWEEIEITRIICQHGSGKVLQEMGTASGFIFKNKHEPSIYWAGDTVWNNIIKETIVKVKPNIIVTHSCGAVWGDGVLIVMDAKQTVSVCLAAPTSTVIATHMDSFDHATVSRVNLRKFAEANNISTKQLLIPLDGEFYNFYLSK